MSVDWNQAAGITTENPLLSKITTLRSDLVLQALQTADAVAFETCSPSNLLDLRIALSTLKEHDANTRALHGWLIERFKGKEPAEVAS